MASNGFKRLRDCSFNNCIRNTPIPAVSQTFRDSIKRMFPGHITKTEFTQFFGANFAFGGMAAAGSWPVVYPLGYARATLVSAV